MPAPRVIAKITRIERAPDLANGLFFNAQWIAIGPPLGGQSEGYVDLILTVLNAGQLSVDLKSTLADRITADTGETISANDIDGMAL